MVGNLSVWIIGSSIIWDAYYHVQITPMYLPGMEIYWDFQPGMRTHHLQNRVYGLLGKQSPPNYLFIHCGGNDTGQSPMNETELTAIRSLQEIPSVTNVRLIWSQILPR